MGEKNKLKTKKKKKVDNNFLLGEVRGRTREKRDGASPAHGHIFLLQPHLKCFQIWSENIGQSQLTC